MEHVKEKLFADPCFQILHYWDADESLYVAVKQKDEDGTLVFPGQSLHDIIENIVKPALSEILCKDIQGDFNRTYSFSMDEKYVLLNGVNQIAVCNI